MITEPEYDEFWDNLFLGCAFAAYVELAVERQGEPDPDTTRRRAYDYYERALAEKNRRKSTPALQAGEGSPNPPAARTPSARCA